MPDPTNSSPLEFSEIYREEQAEISIRRRRQFYTDPDRASHDCVGIALSGGGIRSATFCLGFLQGLNRLKLLRIFDYLSTVSGGGYVGGWWSAWLSRDEKEVRRRTSEPLLELAKNVHNVPNLVTRIASGDDEVSKDLREQIRLTDNFTYRLLTKYAEGESPDQTLLVKLVDQLNLYITTHGLKPEDQPAVLARVVNDPDGEKSLNPTEKADLEQARRRIKEHQWENRFRLEKEYPYELRNNFPPDEMIEPVRRSMEGQEEKSEGSLHAYRDPIHHLRLFANYLTPRTGMLSADTWRAVSVIARNLILTWLILLPLLVTVMLLGQAYLLLNPLTAAGFQSAGQDSHFFVKAMAPLLVLISWSVVIAVNWLICNRESTSATDWIVQLVCLSALFLLLGSGLYASASLQTWVRAFFFLENKKPNYNHLIPIGIWVAVTVVALVFLWAWRVHNAQIAGEDPALLRWRKDVRRSRFSRIQAKLLVTTAVVGVILLVSWLCASGVPKGIVPARLNFSVGLVVTLMSIAGSVFTAFRAKPTSGGDRVALREPSFISRLIFAMTPPMVLVVLATSSGFAANKLLRVLIALGISQTQLLLYVAAMLFIALCIALAVYEMKDVKWSRIMEPSWSAALLLGAVIVNASWGIQALMYARADKGRTLNLLSFFVPLLIAVVSTVFVLSRVVPRHHWKENLFVWLEDLGQRTTGARAEGTRLILKRLQSSFNLIFGSMLIAVLTAIGWLIGSAIFHNMNSAGDGQDKGGATFFQPILLSLVGIAGGAILYRLCLKRKPSKVGPDFEFRWLADRSFTKRPEAHWALAALCLIVPVGFLCLSHVIWVGRSEGKDQLELALFPLVLAALLVVLIFLRSLVIEKFADTPAPQRGWAKVFFDWAGTIIPPVKKHDRRALRLVAILAIIISFLVDPVALNLSSFAGNPRANLILLGVTLILSLPVFGGAIFQLQPHENLKLKRTFRWNWLYSKTALWTLAFISVVLTLIAGWLVRDWLTHISHLPLRGKTTPLLLPGAALCFLLLLFEMFWGEAENRRSIWLIALAYLGFATIFFLGVAGDGGRVYHLKLVLGLLVAVIVWIVALGWMVDPNAVSMHQFYKGRLVRAYMGASNVRRRRAKKTEITETVAGDDLLLTSLHNCDRGGPYHLINTTLNLVGGRDLATAQRSAASFTLSEKHCGSCRTDYRPTNTYMSGQLSLGTAVAASGAAVSPNMGSKKPTAALAMLMTLLNVRLGYWAPTPNRETWNSSQPRLWPFYLLREFFSQTNDVATYCYLTDGGHFDNTGLYSLIERGCPYIVLVDCGADPQPACFQDLGEAIRRCRIDFGTEINLALDPLLDKTTDPDSCFVFGRIQFSREHLEALGKYQPAEESADGTDPSVGTIVYIKPVVVPTVAADVRQYALENKFFPQQTTANQWFDEAQFESYRRLGEFCANKVFNIKAIQTLSQQIRLSSKDIHLIFNELENALENELRA
jgi:hypothetical protein